MKSFLLDTHVFLWMITEESKLTAGVTDILENSDNKLFMSIACLWEIAIKYQLGKLPLAKAPEKYIPHHLSITGVQILPIEPNHALSIHTLPLHHRDPFDRMMICQAKIERIPILTQDRVFRKYDVKTLW